MTLHTQDVEKPNSQELKAKIAQFQKHHHLADIYMAYGSRYLKDPQRQLYIEAKHLRAINQTTDCRRFGKNTYACTDCGDTIEISYSCHHRFCARCGAAAANKWADKLALKIYPCQHAHIVFTLPFALRKLAKLNEQPLYAAMFRLSAKAIFDEIYEKYGIKVGIINVLHTFGSDLKYHPHNHLIVSCGGFKNDHIKYLNTPYLCDHQRLANRFEQLLKDELRYLDEQNALNTEGVLNAGQTLDNFLDSVGTKNWIVGINLTIKDPKHLIGYCGRYLKRACLSEYRLQSIDNDQITFTYKDYKNTQKGEKTVIATKNMYYTQFLDALLQHVPDKGFVGVRYYGLYANGSKMGKIGQNTTTQDLSVTTTQKTEQPTDDTSSDLQYHRQTSPFEDILRCPCCAIERTLVSSTMMGKVFQYYIAPQDG